MIEPDPLSADSAQLLFTVGSVLRGDDAAGPLLAKLMQEALDEGDARAGLWRVIDGGQTPEDELAVVRRLQPQLLLVFDAADMGLAAGEIRRLSIEDVMTDFLITTHSLPISFLLEELRACCTDLVFLGIQPAQTGFFESMTPCVHEAVSEFFQELLTGIDVRAYRTL